MKSLAAATVAAALACAGGCGRPKATRPTPGQASAAVQSTGLSKAAADFDFIDLLPARAGGLLLVSAERFNGVQPGEGRGWYMWERRPKKHGELLDPPLLIESLRAGDAALVRCRYVPEETWAGCDKGATTHVIGGRRLCVYPENRKEGLEVFWDHCYVTFSRGYFGGRREPTEAIEACAAIAAWVDGFSPSQQSSHLPAALGQNRDALRAAVLHRFRGR